MSPRNDACAGVSGGVSHRGASALFEGVGRDEPYRLTRRRLYERGE